MPEKPPQPVFKSINFPVLGIAVLRQEKPLAEQTMLTFDYGRHLGHGQLDKMGVTLFSHGRVLAADYGTCSYGSEILPYYTGTHSHNTVMVDGADQKHTRDSDLLAF